MLKTVLISVSCPHCKSCHVVRNGRTRHGVQNYRCRGVCGRQFVLSPKGRVPEAIVGVVDRMLAAGFSVSTVADLTGASKGWIYDRKKSYDR